MTTRRIDAVERVFVQYDHSTSGGGVDATAVHAADVCLVNHLEVVAFDVDGTQVLVCEQCGHAACATGGWVALRRFGERVLWIPAFGAMDASEREHSEYFPPRYLATHGAPSFSKDAWQQLRRWRRTVPDVRMLPSLTGHEMTRLLQWTAPGRVLGLYPEPPVIRREMIIAVSQGNLDDELRAVEAALARDADLHEPVDVPTPSTVDVVEFWLALPGTPAWRAFGRDSGLVVAIIDDGSPDV